MAEEEKGKNFTLFQHICYLFNQGKIFMPSRKET